MNILFLFCEDNHIQYATTNLETKRISSGGGILERELIARKLKKSEFGILILIKSIICQNKEL